MAVEVLEKLIAYEAEDILELEREETYVIASFLDALNQEEMAEARSAKARSQEESAERKMYEVEDFGDEYENTERRRDMSDFHVNKEAEQFYKRRKAEAVRRENEYLTKEFDMNKKLDELKNHEKILKQDLQEVKQIVRNQLRAEWEASQRKVEKKEEV